jgi:YfiH family protein
MEQEATKQIIQAEYIVPAIFGRCRRLIALQSTRIGGVSDGECSSLNLGNNTGDAPENVQENTRRLCAAATIDPGKLVSSEQVHGTEILFAEKPGRYHGYDAFITDNEDLFLCIYTADCFPVLLYDPRHNASGAVHAGWKGSARQIVMKTIEKMQKCFTSNPEECLAYIGTGISGNAYEVDRGIASAFPQHNSQRSSGEDKYLLDLGAVNYQQLLASGFSPANIERSPFCSYSTSNLFFSYRRDHGKTGRMLSLIGLRA